MNRRVFETAQSSIKSAILDAAAEIVEAQGLKFDRGAYLAQCSFEIDDICKELLFFGAKLFPMTTPVLVIDNTEVAA